MKRHSLALALICKNEIDNFPRLLKSIEGCFDEIHVTDTGSTDGTIEYLQDLQNKGLPDGAKLVLSDFEWVDDFAAARNHSFKDVKTDFVMWMDLDDILSDKEAFIKWRDVAMPLGDYWLANYNYAFDGKKALISFSRERVLRVNKGPHWKYFIHEGVFPMPDSNIQFVHSWTIDHQRTIADMEKDRGRNLKIFEKKLREGVKLCPRMEFYYGKELFENGDQLNAWRVLRDVITREKLEMGDRVLTIQYLANAALILNNPKAVAECIAYAHQGVQLDPTRSEFWCILGDAYLSQSRFAEARPFYITAMEMPNRAPAGSKRQDFIHHTDSCHNQYPQKQLIKCLFNMGDFKEAKYYCDDAIAKYKDPEFESMHKDLVRALDQTARDTEKLIDTTDIVFTTTPFQPYEWDDKIYDEKGVGGSETACIEMAKWLRKLTNRRVLVFNNRKENRIAPDGVEYRTNFEVNDYLSKYKPAIHIAWRHNIKLTTAKTYLWCHDLVTQGVESAHSFDKIFCLSEFHKNYVQAMQNVPDDKIILTRNGIELKRFSNLSQITKNPNKIIFPSSPDRGLDRAMHIMDKAREILPDLELHVYYGLENLKKYNLTDLYNKLEQMIADRPWVKYHGNVEQKVLAQEMMEAVCWIYPANFIESFCITAIESLAARCYPLVRNIGALPYTLKEAIELKQATILDSDALTPEEIEKWSSNLIQIIEQKKWENMHIDMHKYAWESVAKEWIEIFGLDVNATA